MHALYGEKFLQNLISFKGGVTLQCDVLFCTKGSSKTPDKQTKPKSNFQPQTKLVTSKVITATFTRMCMHMQLWCKKPKQCLNKNVFPLGNSFEAIAHQLYLT